MLSNFGKLEVQGEDAIKIRGLIVLGNNAQVVGNYQEATKYYLQTLEMAFQTGSLQTKMIALAGLGAIISYRHQYDIAIEYYQQQLSIAKNINERIWEADALCSLGNVYFLLGNYKKASDLQNDCFQIIREIITQESQTIKEDSQEIKEIQARRLRSLGMINYELKQYETAIDFYKKALIIYRDIKFSVEEGETLVYLAVGEREFKDYQAKAKLNLMDLDSVISNLHQALFFFEQIGNLTLKAKSLKELAKTYEKIGESMLAKSKCDEALEIAKRIKFKALVEECEKMIEEYTENEKKVEYDYIVESQPWYVSELPQPQVINETECQSIKDAIDVVIITATPEELKAIRTLLKPYAGREQVLKVYTLSGTYYLGKIGAYNIVLTKCRMGTSRADGSTLSTYEALIEWHPRAVIMIGIAFGKAASKQNIGDVLVASEIIFYEQQRIGVEGIIDRGIIPPTDETLLNRFDNAQEWKFIRPDGTPCSIIPGPILSGEKLVDDPDFKANLFKRYPQAIGGEMEGTGLCAAARKCKIPWILLKSICDWGDGAKHGKHQPLAAAASANLVHYVLSQPYVLDALKKS